MHKELHDRISKEHWMYGICLWIPMFNQTVFPPLCSIINKALWLMLNLVWLSVLAKVIFPSLFHRKVLLIIIAKRKIKWAINKCYIFRTHVFVLHVCFCRVRCINRYMFPFKYFSMQQAYDVMIQTFLFVVKDLKSRTLNLLILPLHYPLQQHLAV